MTSLNDALNTRFTDYAEVFELSKYGIDSGFSGFIYNNELLEFFDQYEDDILDVIEDLGITPNQLVEDKHGWDLREMKCKAVWIVVEHYCHTRVENHEDALVTA